MDKYYIIPDRCTSCGADCGEGRQVCKECEGNNETDYETLLKMCKNCVLEGEGE